MPVAAGVLGWRAGLTATALAVVAGAWLLALAIVLFQYRAMRPGQLRWDGQAWWWQPSDGASADAHAVNIDLRLDLQSTVLVRMTGQPGLARWCCLERAAAPARWSDLRRALHQRAVPLPSGPEPQP